MSKMTDYSKKLNPIYIESVEANHILINECAQNTDKSVEYKIGNSWFAFQKIKTRKAVLTDSLFLRYMNNKITRNSGDVCRDFIVVRFNYDAEYRIDDVEEKVNVHDLRKLYYKNGVTYTFEKKNRAGETVDEIQIHYKMLMRSPGKAKNGECVFIRDSLHHKAIDFLTMGLYDLMEKQSRDEPGKVFKLVELSAYQTLTTATAIRYIQIPLENILVIKDEEIFSGGMNAAIVELEDKIYAKDEFEVDFDSPRLERIINKKGFTLNKGKAGFNGLVYIGEKTKAALKAHGMSTAAAAELAAMYPEILTNAVYAGNGQITLNEDVVESILGGDKSIVDSQITRLEADKAELAARRSFAEAQLEIVRQVGEGEGKTTKEVARYRLNVANELLKMLVEAGMDEDRAYAAVAENMAGNMDEYNRIVGEVARDTSSNMDTAAAFMADSVSKNSVNAQESFLNMQRKVWDVADAVSAAPDGKRAGSPGTYGGSGSTSKGGIKTRMHSKGLTSQKSSWNYWKKKKRSL